nr:immunoglobulin heavy chain junction region [Macaca mulatta]
CARYPRPKLRNVVVIFTGHPFNRFDVW